MASWQPTGTPSDAFTLSRSVGLSVFRRCRHAWGPIAGWGAEFLKTVVARVTVGSNPTPPRAGERSLTRRIGQGPLRCAVPARHRDSPQFPALSGTGGARAPSDL